jgi:hypothetical protein
MRAALNVKGKKLMEVSSLTIHDRKLNYVEALLLFKAC